MLASNSSSGAFQASRYPPSFHFPPTHYVNFAQAILYRGAGFDIVWRSFATVAGIGLVFFTVALIRFRRTVAVS